MKIFESCQELNKFSDSFNLLDDSNFQKFGWSLYDACLAKYSGAHKRSDANTLFSCGFYIC